MGRFSLEMEFDDDGPSSPAPKRARFSFKQTTPGFLDKIEEDESSHSHDEDEDTDDEEEDTDDEEESVSEQQQVEDEEEEDDDDDNDDIPKVRGSSADVGKVSDRQSPTSSKADGSITVTLTDPDVLDCPICLEPLTIPVFQCENGHIACSCCCSKLKNKCPSCTFPIGYNRCRAIEKVLESIKVQCRNTKYGCSATAIYSKLNDHEKTCAYLPVTCPIPSCDFTAGPTLTNSHVRVHHSESVTNFQFDSWKTIFLETDTNYVILQEKDAGVIFVLNHAVVDRVGSLLSVDGIGLSCMGMGYSYELVARNGSCLVKLQSSAESEPNWKQHTPNKTFLVVPSDIAGSHVPLHLELRIWNESGKYVMSM